MISGYHVSTDNDDDMTMIEDDDDDALEKT